MVLQGLQGIVVVCLVWRGYRNSIDVTASEHLFCADEHFSVREEVAGLLSPCLRRIGYTCYTSCRMRVKRPT